LFVFVTLIAIAPNNFLDVYLYYCIAGLLAYLFSYEAQQKVNQQKELILEKQRAEKLQLVLDIKSTEHTADTITLKDSSKVIILRVEGILFCKGAGDYVEVYLPNRNILHSGSLSSIEEELPNYFMRVHRSYIVNAKHIAFMRRLPGGTGEIELFNGQVVPISRRLLPKLKEALEC
jgi:DNA-binding LytR/AlgR family response regulator